MKVGEGACRKEKGGGGGGMSAGTTPKRKAARDFQGFRKVEQRLAPPVYGRGLKKEF